jgi:hypothetical protein
MEIPMSEETPPAFVELSATLTVSDLLQAIVFSDTFSRDALLKAIMGSASCTLETRLLAGLVAIERKPALVSIYVIHHDHPGPLGFAGTVFGTDAGRHRN